MAEGIKDLIKQVDLLFKLAARVADQGTELHLPLGEGQGEGETTFDIRPFRRFLKQLEEERKAAVAQLRQAVYFHRQVAWLQERFPKAELQDVLGW
jgi:type I restriction enzyme M protein